MRISISVVSGLASLLLTGNALLAQTVEPRDVGRDAHASAAPAATPASTGSAGAAAIGANEQPSVGRNIELKPQATRPATRASGRQAEPPSLMGRWQGFFGMRNVSAPPPATLGPRRDGWLGTTPQQRLAAKTFMGFYRPIPREHVSFRDNYSPGTIIVKTGERRLYYVLGNGQALRYAIGVGREGAAWAGSSVVSDKREWPAWTPTPEIRRLQPDLPPHMEGGPKNPMGARALYLGQTLYRIHGTNEPWMIGEAASHGCIRMTNDDVIDLYNRTRIGSTVIVQR